MYTDIDDIIYDDSHKEEREKIIYVDVELLSSELKDKKYYEKYRIEPYYYYSYKDFNPVEVNLIHNGGEIYEVSCSCKNHKTNEICYHILSFFKRYRFDIKRKYYEDEITKGRRILSKFIEAEPDFTKIKKKVNVEVELVFEKEPSFRLHVGYDKLYVVTQNKLQDFVTAIEDKTNYEFGKNFTYDGANSYFDDKAQEIIDFILGFRFYGNFSEYNPKPYLLSNRETKNLINMLGGKNIKVKDRGIVHDFIKGLPTKFHLTKNKDNNFSLTLDDYENYHILTIDKAFIYYNRDIYMPNMTQQLILDEFNKLEIPEIIFDNETIKYFKNGLFNKIKKDVIIDESITEIKLPTKPNINLYFEVSNLLKCKVEFDYNNEVYNYFDKPTQTRDLLIESNVAAKLTEDKFIVKDNSFIINDTDTIYDFIKDKLEDYNKEYNVFLDKNLKNTKFVDKLSIKNNFSIGEDNILSYKFSIDNIDNNELSNVIKAIRLKKRYYKLKNNQIINLLGDEINEVNDIFDNLNLSKEDIESGDVVIPKYRALYIDSINNKYNNIETNGLFKEFIDNFNEYKNVKLKFDKEDLNILRDYQKEGIKWLYTIYKCDLGGILADEMGLGKSIQTICLIKQIIKEDKNSKIIIVSPTSLVYNWKKEFDKFAPNLKYVTVYENKKLRQKVFKEKDKYNIFITSYGLISHDNDEYEKMNFKLCVIDEAQFIKNYKANMSKEVKKINAKCKIALTGTPIENNILELWSIFDFIMPGYLTNIKDFLSRYNVKSTTSEDKQTLNNLKQLIKPFILRRRKKDVLDMLPDKIENTIYLELPDKQKILYLNDLKETKDKIDYLVQTGGYLKSKIEVLSLLTRLRELCIDPNVIYENYNDQGIKFIELLNIIKENIENNHKMLIFSSFKRVLDNFSKLLEEEDIKYYMIDGSVKSKDRLNMVDNFNNDETPCFLITLKSGGTGLNLIGADTVIHLDIWWNPQAENQATDRAHRIGQQKNVNVIKLVCKGTIEERIVELQEKKKFLSDTLIEDSNDSTIINKLTDDDIINLLSESNDE